MDGLKEYDIPFLGLKQGKHSFTYSIDNKFFKNFTYDDFHSIDCNVYLLFTKKPSLFELQFDVKGMAVFNCDITNETYKEEITNTLHLIVKFGETYNEENEEILILPHGTYQLNVAQYIYEVIVLAMPLKRIHPGVKDGTLKSDVFEKLKELEEENNNTVDPRWEQLNTLLTSKK